MIIREAQRKTWRRINWSTKKERARSVVNVQMSDTGTGDDVTPGNFFDTEKDVFDVMSKTLVQRFTGAFTAPCYHGRLFDELGFTGDNSSLRVTVTFRKALTLPLN